MRVSRMWLDKRHLCMTQNDLRRKTNKVGGNILIIHFMYIHTFREDRSTRRNRVRRMRCVIFLLCVYFSEHIWLVDAHVPYRLFLLRATFCFFFLCLARCRLIEKPSLFRICCFVIVLRVWAWNCLCTCTPNVSKWPASLLFSIFSQFEHPTKFDIRTCTAQRARCVFRGIYSTVPK